MTLTHPTITITSSTTETQWFTENRSTTETVTTTPPDFEHVATVITEVLGTPSVSTVYSTTTVGTVTETHTKTLGPGETFIVDEDNKYKIKSSAAKASAVIAIVGAVAALC